MPASPSSCHASATEPRPRDFSGRFVRGGRRRGPRALSRRASVGVAALAAVSLPAFAAPGGWARFAVADAGADAATVHPMPFEKAGTSFPGSAFYYLELPEDGNGGSGLAHAGDDESGFLRAASPLRIAPGGLDGARALQCLTAAIYYEAASEPDAGQRAVAQVVLNRVAHHDYPSSVCGVVYQGSERATGCQFSFTCDGSMARGRSALFWNRAEHVAREAMGGRVYAPVGLATHYHTVQVQPYWAVSLDYLGTIGAHRFYRFEGNAGRSAAFRFAYGGGEPLPEPRRTTTEPTPAPATLAETGDKAIAAQPGTLPASPAYRATATVSPVPRTPESRLPQSHGIRPEYARSGQWISEPGKPASTQTSPVANAKPAATARPGMPAAP